MSNNKRFKTKKQQFRRFKIKFVDIILTSMKDVYFYELFTHTLLESMYPIQSVIALTSAVFLE